MLANGAPPRIGDPGGPGGGGPSNTIHGEYTGARLPSFMDPEGTAGQLHYLKMAAVSGPIPHDPFLLRLSVEKHIGGPIVGAFKENKGLSYVLKVRSQAQFNRLLKMNQLTDGTAITIVEHPQLNQSKCVVSNHDSTGLSDKYLKQQLAAQGVKDLRRIQRRKSDGTYENTPTIVLTISGTVVPPHIDFGWTRCKTRNFYPSPMQCYRCWDYGHTGKQCTYPYRVCGRCSKVHEEIIREDENSAEESAMVTDANASPAANKTERPLCTATTFCKHCKTDDHSVSNRKCPIYVKEVAIQHLRVDMGISYPQARREYEFQQGASRNSASYSGAVNASKDQEIAELKSMVRQLQTDSKAKDRRLEEMERSFQNRGVGDRIDLTQQNGTIEDLVRQVATLTATVEKMQRTLERKEAELQKKDEIIAELRENTNIVEVQSSPSLIFVPETQEQLSSQFSPSDMQIDPTSITDPKDANQTASRFEKPNTRGAVKKEESKSNAKKEKKKKHKHQNNESNDETNSIYNSANTIETSTKVDTNPFKRNHEETDSNGESPVRSPIAKRSNNTCKANNTSKDK